MTITHITNKIGCSKHRYPLSRTNLAEPKEGGEEVVGLEPRDHPVSGDGSGVHAKESKNNAYNEAKAKNGSQQDYNDHNMVAANICGDRNDDDGDKNNTGGHHGNGVEDAGEEKGDPVITSTCLNNKT